jgi:hypothetical protein
MYLFGSKSDVKAAPVKSSYTGSKFVGLTSVRQQSKNPFSAGSGITSSLTQRQAVGFSTTSAQCDYSYPAATSVVLPNIIKGHYTTDLPIVKIHEAIRDVFSYYRHNSPMYLAEITALMTDSDHLTLETIARRKKADDIRKTLDKFTEDSWNKYVTAAKPLLDQYITLTTYGKVHQFVFGGKAQEKTAEQDKDLEERAIIRVEIIERYLHLARDFITMDVVYYPQSKIGCPVCGQTIEEMEVNEDQGSCYCACGNWFDYIYSSEAPHQDPDRIEVNTRSAYEDKTNFIRCINAYQGIQEREIPSSLIEELGEFFHKDCGMPPSEVIKAMTPDEYGHRGKETSIRLLEYGLKETKNTGYYRDMDLIAHLLWGWQLPDISHLVSVILDDYSRTQEVFREIHPVGSSINVHLRLFWHLRAVKYNCRLEDFKVPSNSDTLKRQSAWFKEMCERTNLTFTPII